MLGAVTDSTVRAEVVQEGRAARVEHRAVPFRRGWYARPSTTSGSVPPAGLGDWTATRAGGFDVRVDPALRWQRAASGDVTVLVLGDPVDLATDSTDPAAITRQILDDLLAGGVDRAVRTLAYLGGRHLTFLATPEQTVVVPDTAASHPAFWTADGSHLSSHTHLLAELTGASQNAAMLQVIREAQAAGVGGTFYFPAMQTPFLGQLPLLADHLLRLDAGGPRHERFYPFADTVLEPDVDRAYALFRDAFTQHVELLCRLGRPAVSLSGGNDSRTTFAAALPHLRTRGMAWTFFPFGNPNAAAQTDLLTANAIAFRHRVPHQVIDVRRTEDQLFRAAWQRTYRLFSQHKVLAEAVHDQVAPDIVNLQSMVAETGTGRYNWRQQPLSVKRLAYLHHATEHGKHPALREAYAEYLEHTDLAPERLAPWNWHDLYYLEVRVSRWAMMRVQELDMCHQVALPFGCRQVLEALGGPPLDERKGKQAMARLRAELGV